MINTGKQAQLAQLKDSNAQLLKRLTARESRLNRIGMGIDAASQEAFEAFADGINGIAQGVEKTLRNERDAEAEKLTNEATAARRSSTHTSSDTAIADIMQDVKGCIEEQYLAAEKNLQVLASILGFFVDVDAVLAGCISVKDTQIFIRRSILAELSAFDCIFAAYNKIPNGSQIAVQVLVVTLSVVLVWTVAGF